ncbi:hypothetical protein jhhlp_002519 [Lomentospora prolificans]|uniref:Trm112p-like protein n=1 Tax=Lomentospora prolificans TaxID=41688 RepID=A0A2N3NEH4_9PEZI|nr:hypothetical protein jhhlp_002519 [Lomentospora prolificans]
MRVLNLNFFSCAVKTCKVSNQSFPLHPKDAELAQDDDAQYRPEILVGLLPRLDWAALKVTCAELGFPELPENPPTVEALQEDEKLAADLHRLLMETHIVEGKLACGSCGREYPIREGIPNFLLPSHLV